MDVKAKFSYQLKFCLWAIPHHLVLSGMGVVMKGFLIRVKANA